MGEVQGSLWTTTLFIILFAGMSTMLFWAIDIMHYNSAQYAIEDNIKAGNLDYIKTLGENFNVCGTVYDTKDDCSGILESDDERVVKYQLSFNGIIMEKDASGENDHLVLLPY